MHPSVIANPSHFPASGYFSPLYRTFHLSNNDLHYRELSFVSSLPLQSLISAMQNVAFDGNESIDPSCGKPNQQIYDSFDEDSRLSPAKPMNGRDGNEGEGKREPQLSSQHPENKYDDQPSEVAETPKINPTYHWHSFIAALSGGLIFVGMGCAFGWSSSAEKYFVGRGIVDKLTWGWIAGFAPFGAIFTPIPMGYLSEKFGHKPCLLGTGSLLVVAWLIVGLANGAPMLLIGRFFAGMALGGAGVVLPLYINEIATNDVRPTLGATLQLSLAFGIVLAFMVGPYVHPWVLALFSGTWPVLHVVTFLAIPESPYVLLKRGDRRGASKSLAWLRGQSESEVANELDSIQMITDKMEEEKVPFIKQAVSIFTKRGNRKAFLLAISLATLTQGSGYTPVAYYTRSIFEATGSQLDPSISALIIATVKLLASVSCVILTKFYSMKALLVISGFGMAAGHCILGLYFFQKDRGDVSQLEYVPLIGLIIFIVLYSAGYGPLSYVVSGEFQSAGDGEGASLGMCMTYVWVLTFLSASLFPVLLAILSQATTFFIFSGNCIFAAIFAIAFLPNTRNKSLEEIRLYLDKRSR